MAEEIKVNWKEIYDIETPTSIAIGDPLYFDEMEDPKTQERVKNNMKSLTLIKDKIPKSHKARLIFSELDYDGYLMHEVKLVVCNEKYLDVYCDDKYYPDAVVEVAPLGCDTAQYDIYVNYGDDHKYYNVHTGADGYFGDKQLNKGMYGFNCSFTFPSDLMEVEEMRQILSGLFKCDSIKNNKRDH